MRRYIKLKLTRIRMKLRSEEQTNELKADKTNELEPFKPRWGNVATNHNSNLNHLNDTVIS